MKKLLDLLSPYLISSIDVNQYTQYPDIDDKYKKNTLLTRNNLVIVGIQNHDENERDIVDGQTFFISDLDTQKHAFKVKVNYEFVNLENKISSIYIEDVNNKNHKEEFLYDIHYAIPKLSMHNYQKNNELYEKMFYSPNSVFKENYKKFNEIPHDNSIPISERNMWYRYSPEFNKCIPYEIKFMNKEDKVDLFLNWDHENQVFYTEKIYEHYSQPENKWAIDLIKIEQPHWQEIHEIGSPKWKAISEHYLQELNEKFKQEFPNSKKEKQIQEEELGQVM
ncbi:hypothetical protein ACW95P_04210 [Candidatus Mycoplasma pogonae]